MYCILSHVFLRGPPLVQVTRPLVDPETVYTTYCIYHLYIYKHITVSNKLSINQSNLYDDTDEIMTLNLPETCKYFDLDDETLYFTNLQHISYNFKCMHLNIQSLSAKFD